METALTGVRILDLTRALAGPYCSLILGDLGAEIIKIEAVAGRQDVTGPYAHKGQDAYFMAINRSKRSLTLDLRKEEGQAVFHDLVKVADVVLDNFRPGILDRLRADYGTLKEINPKIISCSITGFGSDGPYRDRPAYDLVVQAISGTMSITGEPGRPPTRSGIAVGDQGAGMFAAHGILAALYRRDQSGVGSQVETSLLEATIAQLAYEAGLYLVSGIVPGPVGSGHRTLPFYRAFATRDGYVAIAAINRFPHLCRAIEREDLIEDERFQGKNLTENRDEFITILEEVFPSRDTSDWLERLTEADVPCGPVNTLDQAFVDEQVLARDMLVTIDHTLGGQVRQTGNPIKMSVTPPETRRWFLSPPTLGEHTDELLSGLLGYPEDRIKQLRREKTI